MPTDSQRFAAGVHEYLKRALAGVHSKIEALESRINRELESRDDLSNPTLDTIRALSAASDALTKAMTAIPAPELPDFDALAQEAVSRASAAIPAPELPDFDALAQEAVSRASAAIPAPEPKHGKDCDMQEVKAHLDSLYAQWALEFERRASEVLERAASRIPKPVDGADGLGFDDLDVTFEDGEFNLRFTRGERVKEFKFALPVLTDCGVYNPEGEYKKGAGVTWAGSFWIAQVDSPAGKPGESSDWRLAVKRGRDGRDLREGNSSGALNSKVRL